jgi:hypothetical protein
MGNRETRNEREDSEARGHDEEIGLFEQELKKICQYVGEGPERKGFAGQGIESWEGCSCGAGKRGGRSPWEEAQCAAYVAQKIATGSFTDN